VVVAVVALAAPVLMLEAETARARLVALEELTRFLDRALHTRREAPEVRVTVALTERLVQITEVMVVKVAMVIHLQMVAMEVLE
jgi:hypothetical protein